ncbi:MAG: DUF2059 domain-containing protein [Flavobacterium sp.]
MKKVFFALLFVGAVQFASAQDDAFKKDVLKVIQLSGSDAQMKLAKDQIIKMIPQDKHADFIKDFDASMPSLYDKLAKVYMETYTKEDVKSMLAFYESPVGKKITAKSGELSEKSMAAAMEWSEGLQGMMMKYMQ